MRQAIFAILCIQLTAGTALAGPWAREKGQVFVATTGTYSYGLDTELSSGDGGIYAEYGLTHRLTLGFAAMDNLYDYTHAYVFLRRTLSSPNRRLKLAASIGVGASRRADEWAEMARIGFSVGQPTTWWKPGWWSVRAAIEDHALWDEPIYKLDATFGVNLTDRLKTIVDLETSHRPGDTDTHTLRTSLAWDTGRGTHLLFGIEAKDSVERAIGLRAGWWRQF